MTVTPTDTLAELDSAVARADAALAEASARERGPAEAAALAARLRVARRVLMDSAPSTFEGVRLAIGVAEWLRIYVDDIGPDRVQALSDFLRRPSQAESGSAVRRVA